MAIDVGDVIVVVIHREQRVVGIDMDAVGGSGLQGDRWRDVIFCSHLQTDATLFGARHDEVDELTGVGVGTGGRVLIDVLAIEATVPDDVVIGVVITRQTELELGRTVHVAQVDSVDALALQVALHDGVTRTRRHIDVAELGRLKQISPIDHDVVAAVDGVGNAGLHTRIQEIVLLIVAVGSVGKLTILEEAGTPDLSERELHAEVHVEAADEPVDLVPNATVVAVGIIVIINDVADLGHMVCVEQVGLTLISFKVFGILINIVVVVAAKQVIDALVIMCPRDIDRQAACHDQVGLELMLEVGSTTCLHLVVVTFGEDILREASRHCAVLAVVGVLHREKVVAVSHVEAVPVDLGDFRVAVTPCLKLRLDFRLGHVIARQVFVVVGTRVGSFTPFQRGLTSLASKKVGRGLEGGLPVRRPIPSEAAERLVIGAHARVADNLRAVGVDGLIAPVGVVVVGPDKVVGFLHHGCRAATLRGGAEHGEVEAVLVVELLLHGEEIAIGLVERTFRVARHGAIQVVLPIGIIVAIGMNPRIASAGGSHQIPALPYLACADGSHGAVVVGTVAESIAHGNLLAVLRCAGRESRQATQVAEAGTGLAKAFYNKRVTESVVEAAPRGSAAPRSCRPRCC